LNEVSPGSLIVLGKVIRPHGLSGLLRIHSYAASESAFLDAGKVFLRDTSGETNEYTITYVRPHKNIFLMKLRGLNNFEEAEKHKGADILIGKDALSRKEGEYFWYELIGLRVYLESGAFVGTLSGILPTGGHDIYVVKAGDKEVLIPAVQDIVKAIELEKGRMVVSDVEGLLDVNEI